MVPIMVGTHLGALRMRDVRMETPIDIVYYTISMDTRRVKGSSCMLSGYVKFSLQLLARRV